MKNKILSFAAILLFHLGTSGAVEAQVESVQVRVDGLACPFCAYGLEKKLKRIEGVGGVKINVDKGVATLQNKKEHSIAVERLEEVVKKAGFTPREVSTTVVGKVGQKDGTWVLWTDHSEVQFILKVDEEFKKLRAKLQGSEGLVRITGHLVHETPEGHHAHPFTLRIEKFEVLK
ncbi:MAG: copper chaperone [Calditrichaeota bacterium]|nr:MAG: copper chaperone [Calditrichota bacterium]